MKRLRTTILFSVPALIFGGILLYFIFWNFRNSLMDYSLIHSHPIYVGLQTYQLVFSDPSFTSSLLRSLIWSGALVGGGNAIGILIGSFIFFLKRDDVKEGSENTS